MLWHMMLIVMWQCWLCVIALLTRTCEDPALPHFMPAKLQPPRYAAALQSLDPHKAELVGNMHLQLPRLADH